MWLFVCLPCRFQVADDVRQLAGLLLKNYVVRNAQAFVREGTADVRDYIKLQVLISLLFLILSTRYSLSLSLFLPLLST